MASKIIPIWLESPQVVISGMESQGAGAESLREGPPGYKPSASQWPAQRAVLLSEGSRELPLHTCSWLPPDTVFGFKRLLQSSHFKSRASVIMDTHIQVLICQINIQSHCVLTSYAATLSSKNGIIRNNGKLALKDLLYFSVVKKQYS